MATIADLLVRIGADTSDLRKKIAATKRQLNSAFGSQAMEFSQGLVKGVAAAGAALAGLGVYAVNLAGKFESTQVAFTNMLGSAEKATALTKDLQAFAAKTPFNFQGLAQSSQKLLAFGFTAEQIIPTMTAIGDAAAGLGGSQEIIDRITLALGQMAAKGRVQADEMLQLTEAGIPAWQMLADKIGTSIPEAMDMVSKGMVDAQTGLVALTSGMEAKFGGMMEDQSKTISGSWSNLMDSMEATAITTGKAISDALNLPDIFNGLADSLSQFNETLQTSGIGAALKELIPPTLQPVIVAVSGAILGAMIPALIALGSAAAATLVPLIPYIAIGAAIAVAIYAILDPADAFTGALEAIGISAYDAQEALNYYSGEMDGVIVNTLTTTDALDGCSSGFYAFADSVSNAISPVKGLVDWLIELGSRIEWVRSLMGDLDLSGRVNGLNITPTVPDFGIGWLLTGGQSAKLKDKGYKGLSASDKSVKEYERMLNGYDPRLKVSTYDESTGDFTNVRTGRKMPSYDQFRNKNLGTSAGGGGGGSSGGGSGESAADREAKRLASEADRITKQIGQAWDQLFATQSQQADNWYNDQLASLNKSKDANENYQDDLDKLNQIYAQKKRKAAQDEAAEQISAYKKVHDAAVESLVNQNVYGSASQNAIRSMEMDYSKTIDGIKAKWQDFETQFIGMTDTQRDRFLKNLQAEGIAYKVSEDGKLSLAEQTAADIAAAQKAYEEKSLEYHVQCKDFMADKDEAFAKNSLSTLKTLLNAENAARLSSYNASQAIMQDYYDNWVETSKNTSEQVADIITASKQTFTDFFTDTLTGAQSFGESLLDLFDGIWKNIVNSFAQQWSAGIANKLMGGLGLLGGNTGSATDVEGGGISGASGIGEGTIIGGQSDPMANFMQAVTGATTALNSNASATTAATGLLSAFGGVTQKGSMLMTGYNAIQGVINTVAKPTETTATTTATMALTALATAATAASTALALMSAKSSFGFGFFASGGAVSGPGSATSDSIPAWLSDGEYVLNAEAVNRLGVPFLNALNSGKRKKFALGGLVTRSVPTGRASIKGVPETLASAGGTGSGSGGNQTVHLTVNALDASGFEELLDRGGLDKIKQALFSDNRNFATNAGVW